MKLISRQLQNHPPPPTTQHLHPLQAHHNDVCRKYAAKVFHSISALVVPRISFDDSGMWQGPLTNHIKRNSYVAAFMRFTQDPRE